ncbi:MAG TPA: NlpC/P60 family protein [Desulfatiglandales bacterium]|nr:NlpC/P60 family protein [Desulfatiglandales bacterium]
MGRKPRHILTFERKRNCILIALFLLMPIAGCGERPPVPPVPLQAVSERRLATIGYSIQAGAFTNLDNAVRLVEGLEGKGLNAYYFVHESGLYKVRFGNFPSKQSAQEQAESLRADGTIDEYYIVSPDDYAAVKERTYGQKYLRFKLVETAERFIGVPYRWGGSSPDAGFDCSGLTMTVYHLNGLNLPRSSKEQFMAGVPVKRRQLSRGDLVFFATSGGETVSHVGIYAGRNRFIHASGRGKKIRIDSLSKRYFKNRYAGARTYIW